MKISKKEKILAAIVCVVILMFSVDKFLLSGLRLKASALSQKIKLDEAQLKTGINIQKRKDKIIAEYDKYKSYLDINSSFSDKEVATKFLKEIENIAQQSSVAIVNLTPQNQPVASKDHKSYKVELRVEANMEQLLNLLFKIQSSSLLIKLDTLSLTPKDEEASVLKIEATISMAVPQ